ncbi:MAG: adenylate/guanylate cyclase domain-containing protein [Rhodocyclaceae bacterium]|nr:MAG: adenylate/guanylate cyclase domain-containing protein [Rhodocyclaceae bacterium]
MAVTSPPDNSSFFTRLRNAGIEPGDSEQLRLAKSLLVFATGLVSSAAMVWLGIYWILGPQLSSTYPYIFELLLAGNLLLYIKTRNFDFFRVTQIGLFLFVPFAVQWSIGNFVTASGVILWGLLAPVGALVIFGIEGSLAWFLAWIFFTGLSGFFDWYLADMMPKVPPVPMRTSVVFFALNFMAVSTLLYILLRHAITEQRKIGLRLEEAHAQLQVEQERAEKLLLNILPAPVAKRLKESNQTIADGFADATVMFADIVNFTQVAAGMSPSQVFAMLNRIFSAFDDLAEQFGLEKIKTIGDAYMVAGGINDETTDYTAAIANMAVSMRNLLARDFAVNTSHLKIRIGIGTGPVVAGVVGKKKFIYDLWGDTVNIASRITSEGSPGSIHCDQKTRDRLHADFDLSQPITLTLKGKGEMTIYEILGPLDN